MGWGAWDAAWRGNPPQPPFGTNCQSDRQTAFTYSAPYTRIQFHIYFSLSAACRPKERTKQSVPSCFLVSMAQLLATSTRSAAAAASVHERTVKVVPRVALSPFAHTVVRSTVSQARRDVARRSVIAQAKVRRHANVLQSLVMQRCQLYCNVAGPLRLVRTASIR